MNQTPKDSEAPLEAIYNIKYLKSFNLVGVYLFTIYWIRFSRFRDFILLIYVALQSFQQRFARGVTPPESILDQEKLRRFQFVVCIEDNGFKGIVVTPIGWWINNDHRDQSTQNNAPLLAVHLTSHRARTSDNTAKPQEFQTPLHLSSSWKRPNNLLDGNWRI